MKYRIIKTTLLFGSVGTVISTVFFGQEVGIPYASGVVAGSLYLFLLGKKTDGIGASYTLSNSTFTKLDSIASNLRLFVPVALMGGLALRNSLINDAPLKGLSTLSRDQFLGAIVGFLTYRLAIFVSEVATELRTEDVLSILPGSAAEMFRQTKALTALNDKEKVRKEAISTVLLLTGPRAAGRAGVREQLLLRGYKSAKTKGLTTVKYLTTDTAAWTRQPDRYKLVTSEELDQLRNEGSLVCEIEERNAAGLTWISALSINQFEASALGNDVYVIDGPPSLLSSLSR
jgi:hypothetical protein